MTDKELMRMALNALKYLSDPHHPRLTATEAIEALRSRLKQPDVPEVGFGNMPKKAAWVGLTDDEIKGIIGPWGGAPIKGYTRTLFDQIEAKLKEKNT